MKKPCLPSRALSFFVLWTLVTLHTNGLKSQVRPDLLRPFQLEIYESNLVQFLWTKWYDAQTYDLQVSQDPDFNSLVINQSGLNNNFYSAQLQLGLQYYWRVRSQLGGFFSVWSAFRTFRVQDIGSISGLVGWIDPNNGVLLNNNSVAEANDWSTFGNNAFQANSSQQPQFRATDTLINRKSIFRFDGVNDFLQILDDNSLDFTDQFNLFSIVKPTVIATNKTILAKWDYPTQGAWVLQTEFSVANQFMLAPCFNITDPGNQKTVTTNANMIANEPALINVEYNGNLNANKIKFFKNFVQLSTNDVGPIPSSLPNCSATLKIGKYGGTADRYYQGDIGEIILFDRVLNATERTQINQYYRYKYCPPVFLGNDTVISNNLNCGNLILKPTNTYKSYLWSNGSTNKQITVNTPGKYWLTAVDYFGNVSSDTILILPPFNPNYPPGNGNICQNNSVNWAPNFNPANFSYQWQDNSTSPNYLITSPGQYYFKVTDGNGCVWNSDTLTFTIDTYASTTTLGPDTTMCEGNRLALQTNAAQTVSYLWPDGSANPTYAVDTSGAYFVTATNVNGCVAKDTVQVTIAGVAPTANWLSLNRCFKDSTQFIDQSTPLAGDPIVQWNWDFGNGQTSSLQNPKHRYASPGNYTVDLLIQAQNGCRERLTQNIRIHALPQAQFASVGNCSNEAIGFSDQSTAGDTVIQAWSWNFGQPGNPSNTSSLQNPSHLFNASGAQQVQLIITDANNCQKDTTKSVVLAEAPVAQFQFEEPCENQAVTFQNQSSVSAPANLSNYFWDFNGSGTSTAVSPSKSYTSFGNKTTTLIAFANNGCSDTLSQTFLVHDNPAPVINASPACVGNFTEFTDASICATDAIVQSNWLFDFGSPQQGISVKHVFPATGVRTVTLNTVSTHGCNTDFQVYVDVQEGLSADWDYSPDLVVSDQPVIFQHKGFGANIFQWNFGDGSSSNEANPIYTFSSPSLPANFTVQLIAKNDFGCSDTLARDLTLQEARLGLAVRNLLVERIGDRYAVSVLISNDGAVRIDSVELQLKSSNGENTTENFSTGLNSGETMQYAFDFQPLHALNDATIEWMCVVGIPFLQLNLEEEDLLNNRFCINLKSIAPMIIGPNPNPVSESLTFSVLLIDPDILSIDLVDASGKIVQVLLNEQEMDSGLFDFSVPTLSFQSGLFYLRMKSKNSQLLRKVVIY